ncbi:MAG: HAD-IA family hydrolase, partial [Clostridia bacterium]|nr:HAD-IA family hydrolase [Clostridia bacterium]
YLESVGVISYFHEIVTGSGLPSKPAPDVFLKAAAALNAKPEACLVLEDSIHGVQAGRAAGMTVFMIPDVIPYNEALKPFCDRVLPDLAAVIPLLEA